MPQPRQTPGDRARRLQLQAEAELYSRHLPRFIRGAWPVIEPGTEFDEGWHIDLIAENLEAVSAGEIRRLIINVPPRYMKSISVSVMWPVWTWTTRPELRFMFSSYAQGLAAKHSHDRRTVIQSDWYQERWRKAFALAGDQNVKTEFLNTKRGHMVATSFKGTATGKGGDVLVIDDPLDPEDAWSTVERERVNRTFDQKFSTRLDNKATGAIVVVMQRLHENDLTGHLLGKGGWEHLCLTGEAEAVETVTFPRSKREVIRLPGEVLWPGHESADVVDRQKLDMGGYAFASQYQQRPTPIEGGIFKRGWWRFFDPEQIEGDWTLPAPGRLVTSWDTALKAKTSSDYTVGTAWAFDGANRYLLRVVRGRWTFPEIKREVKQLAEWVERKFPNVGHTVLVENAATGPEVVAELRDEVPGLLLTSPDRDKVARAHAATPQIESGNVFLPGFRSATGDGPDLARTPPEVQDLIEECAVFDRGAHDDQVDSLTQALLKYRPTPPLPGRPTNDIGDPRKRAVTAGLGEMEF